MDNNDHLTKVFLNITLNDDTVKSLRLLQSPAELRGKVILVYIENLHNGPLGTLMCLLNGNMIGPAIASINSNLQLEKLSTTDEPYPTADHPIKYCLYLDDRFTIEQGVWQLIIDSCPHLSNPRRPQHSYHQTSELLIDEYNKIHNACTHNAYMIHHHFSQGGSVSIGAGSKL
jgi:hypothetical protein